jgi:hypothetical protein
MSKQTESTISAAIVVMIMFECCFCFREDFTIIALPDTQSYFQSYPATFTSQTRRIGEDKTLKTVMQSGQCQSIIRMNYDRM